MKRQDIFNKVYKHLLKQNEKAIDVGGNCQYRTGEGLQCAVGCLIDEDHYDDVYEGSGVYALSREELGNDAKALRQSLKLSNKGIRLGKETIDMLSKLQDIHDRQDPEDWLSMLAVLATKYNLKVPA